MDHATFVNAPKTIELGGREYRVSALTLKEWGPVQSWIKQHAVSPVRLLSSGDMAGLNAADRKAMMETALHAQRNWPPRIGSIEWFQALDHPGGHAEFLFVALSKHQPDFTREEAAGLDERISVGDATPVVMACLGLDMPDDNAPKAKGASQTDRRTTD